MVKDSSGAMELTAQNDWRESAAELEIAFLRIRLGSREGNLQPTWSHTIITSTIYKERRILGNLFLILGEERK